LLAAASVEIVAITAGAALVAVSLAIAISPLFPLGIARLAEPNPGISMDWRVLGIGAAAVVVTMLLAALPSMWRAAGASGDALGLRRSSASRPSVVAESAQRAGFPASFVVGVRMALERGRGRTQVPVRSALLGATLALISLTMAFTFGASFH